MKIFWHTAPQHGRRRREENRGGLQQLRQPLAANREYSRQSRGLLEVMVQAQFRSQTDHRPARGAIVSVGFVLLLVCLSRLILADVDDPDEVQPCTFEAHTPMGTITGQCSTQPIPGSAFNLRWKLVLSPDQQSRDVAKTLKTDHFYDMVRAQSLEDGGSTVILPLWGDFRMKPTSQEYIDAIRVTAPLYETRPTEITISQISSTPLTFEFLFAERQKDFVPALRTPSREWVIRYLESFYRLGTNRPDGFSR